MPEERPSRSTATEPASTPVAPAIAPAILALSGGGYGVLFAVAGVCGLLAAAAILPVKRVG